MSNANRVVWSEGMFLRVQHFQQSDRWAENLVASTAQLLSPFAWGVSRLVINPGLLEDARLGLVEARGLLPDGTPFSAPDEVELPPPLELEEGTKEHTVYLTLPTRQPGAPEIASGPAPGGNANALRYAGEARELADTNQGSPVVMPVEVGRLRLRLRLEGEDLAGFERIPIARVAEVRSDRSVVLDESFVPTCLNCSASLPLETMASEILGTVGHRAEAIADRMGDPSVRGTAEVTDFQFLQVLNRYEVALRHIGETLSVVHPERLYATLATLAGEMATFTRERRRPPAFPGYRHADLTASFAPVMAELRASLSAVLERSAIEIRLEERRHGVRVEEVAGDAYDDPFWRGRFAHVVRCRDHGRIADPGAYVAALFDHFLAEGGTFLRAEICDVAMDGGRCTGLETDRGAVGGDAVVLALGAWAAPLARRMGARVPAFETERGYHVELVDPSAYPRDSMMVASGKFAVNAMEGRIRCAGVLEFGGLAAPASAAPLAMLRRRIARLFQGVTWASEREWMGHRPAPADSLPLIGPTASGGYAAFGHQHVGLTAGPKTGRILAGMIGGEARGDWSAFDPMRR